MVFICLRAAVGAGVRHNDVVRRAGAHAGRPVDVHAVLTDGRHDHPVRRWHPVLRRTADVAARPVHPARVRRDDHRPAGCKAECRGEEAKRPRVVSGGVCAQRRVVRLCEDTPVCA